MPPRFRTVLDVKVVDVEKRRNPSKHYVYLINVTYSDNTSHIIYRRYSKFFDLQMQILDKFPIEGGQKDPKKRIIPFLPGNRLLPRPNYMHLKGLRLLCPPPPSLQALVRLPPQISQSEEVLRFFETKAEDVNPPVEWLTACFFRSGMDSSEPMVLEQYVAVANYERQENSEISLKAGETVDVIEKSESGWWFVSTAEEQGWVPATYLDSQNGTRDDLDLGTSRTGEEEKYVTIQPYSSQGKDEVSFEKGVTVEVIQKNLEGWWFIRWASHTQISVQISLLPCLTVTASHFGAENNPPDVERDQPAHALQLRDQRRDGPAAQRGPGHQQPVSGHRGGQRGLPKPPEPPAVEAEYYTIADFQSSISDGISFRGGQKADVRERAALGSVRRCRCDLEICVSM
uniref:SH3 and PX domains 2Aa n=1 Tax=Salarias fasciatus TaxID=181472 RepID=A0A672H8U3_SALFA